MIHCCLPCMIGFVLGPGCVVRFVPLLFQLISCADPDTLVTFFFFLVNEGGERIQITQKAGRHRPASETPFRWRFAGGPMIAQL